MKTTEITKSEINGSLYIRTSFQALGNTFSVMQVSGKANYVNVCKETNNPYKTLGKSYLTWNDVMKNYKSAAMLFELTLIEAEFKKHLSNNIPSLDLASLPITKSTASLIFEFIYCNREILSDDLKMFYNDVKGILEIQLRKPAERRLKMNEILERAYNIEKYILAAGAASFQQEIIRLTKNN